MPVYRTVEAAFCFLAISNFAGAYFGFPAQFGEAAASETGASDPYSAAANGVILVILAVLCYLHRRKFLAVALCGTTVNIFILLAACSALWSLAPDVTLRRTGTLITTVGFGYFLVARFPFEEIIRKMALAFLVAGFVSAVASIVLPDAAVMKGDLAGDWRGIFPHKNTLGEAMMLGCLCHGWLVVHERVRRTRNVLGFLFCFLMAVMSNSRTYVLVVVLSPLVGYCLYGLRLPGLLRVWVIYLMTLSVGALGILAYLNFDELVGLLGKDPSLTGRTPLWELLLSLIAERPVLGHGYGAFWLKWNRDVVYIWKTIQWSAPEAHNSYIDVLLGLGIAGLVVACGVLGSVFWRSARAMSKGNLPWSDFALLYTLAMATTGVFETNLLRSGDIHSMLLSMLYVALRLNARTHTTSRTSYARPLAQV